MGHDDREGGGVGHGPGGEFGGRRDDELMGRGEALPGGKGGAGIGDGHVPAEFIREAREGLGIVAGAEDHEARRRSDPLVKDQRAGRGRRILGGGEACAEGGGVGGRVRDGEAGGAAKAEVFRERESPHRVTREFFDHDPHDPVAAETDAPDEVVLRGRIINDGTGAAAGEDLAGVDQNILLEAAATDGTEATAIGGEQQPRTGTAVRRALHGGERGQHGVARRGGREGIHNGLELFHRREKASAQARLQARDGVQFFLLL